MAVEVDSFKPYELTRAFHLVLRALGQRYTYREVAARLGRHPQSGSLLAVADLAPSFGTEVTAVRCDFGDIDSESVPVVLQLQSGESSGFATVVGVSDDGFSIFDSIGVPGLISWPELARLATGVTVFVEISPSPARPERAYWLNHLRDLVSDLGERLSRHFPAFSGTGGGMRLFSLALLATSVILALKSSLNARSGPLTCGLAAVVTVGALLSFILFGISRSAATGFSPSPLSRRLCNQGGLLDCDSVLHSRWASVGPWTLASLGVAWFLSLLASFGWVGILAADKKIGVLWLAVSLLLAVPVSLLLVLVQAWPLKKLCPLCMAIHLAVFAGAAAGRQLLASPAPYHLFVLWPVGLIQIWFFSLVLGLLMPWIKDSGDLAKLRSELTSVRATPLGSLSLLLDSPLITATAGLELMQWGSPQAPLSVAGFVNPMCSACGPVLAELLTLAQSHGDKIRVAIHLVEMGGLHKSGERSLLLAVLAIASLQGREAAVEALWTIKRNPEQCLREATAGAGQVGARLAGCSLEEIDEALPPACEALERASTIARLARSGLPFVLVAGRRFPASVRHLDILIGSHYPLLLESLGIDRAG